MAIVYYAAVNDLHTVSADADATGTINPTTITSDRDAVESAVATLEADGATPTQAHVNALRTVWNTLKADIDGPIQPSHGALELRMGNGTFSPTRFDALTGIRRIERWLQQGGLDGLGTNLPQPT